MEQVIDSLPGREDDEEGALVADMETIKAGEFIEAAIEYALTLLWGWAGWWRLFFVGW